MILFLLGKCSKWWGLSGAKTIKRVIIRVEK
jgi:hypothetical protein